GQTARPDDDRVGCAGRHRGGSPARAQRGQSRTGEEARTLGAPGAFAMMPFIRRWLARTDVRLTPRAISGREVAFVDGFSPLESERAGLTEDQAVAAGLTIDRARTSALGSNVMQLEKLRRAHRLTRRGWS